MILTVLGIIGRILLIILFVVLALLAIVLFVPVRYQAAANSEKKTMAAKIAAIFGLIRLKASLSGGGSDIGVYLLWFRLPFFKKDDTPEEEEPREEEIPESPIQKIRRKIPFLSNDSGTGEEDQKNARKKRRKVSHLADDEDDEELEAEMEALREQKAARRERILDLVETFFDREIFSQIFQPLQKLLFRIRPRECRGLVEFGMEDPSYTGYLCGVLSMIPFLYGTELVITPDFEAEETYFRGNVWLRGRILTIFVLIFALRLLLNKDIRRFFGKVRKMNKGEKQHG